MHTKAYNLISQVQNRFLQVKGISLNERTFIDKAKFRKILRSVLSKSISVESIKKQESISNRFSGRPNY